MNHVSFMERLLITAETVLPISSNPLSKGAVLIAGGKIRAVGKASQLRKTHKSIHTIDLGQGILLPGFVNGHTHLELGWVGNHLGQFSGFMEWIEQIILAKTEEITRQEIEKAVEHGVRSLVESGVTTVGEISSYGGLDKPILEKSGLRTVLFKELFDRHDDFWNVFSFDKNEIHEERPFPHSPYSCSPEFLKKVFKFSGEKQIPVGIHLAESPDELKFVKGEENGFENKILPMVGRTFFPREKARTPFQYIKGLGISDRTKVTAVHMVQVLPEEVEEIYKYDLGIVLCPRSNLFLKVGSPPVKHYTKIERLGIGTDGLSSNFNLDFFEELRFFYLTFADNLGKQASFFTVYLATLGGAKALFLEDKIGSIEEGKEADLIFLSSENFSSDPYFSVISSSRDNVKLVMVKGKVIFQK